MGTTRGAIAWGLCVLVAACGGAGGGGTDAGQDGDPGDVADTTGTDGTGDAAEDATGETGCSEDGDCDDADPCTVDACETATGLCEHDPVDTDGDGFAAVEVEGVSCGGTDCDDGDPDVYPGSADLDCSGGGGDRDCDGLADHDEDGDGWTTDACASGEDCDDGDPDVFPGSTVTSCDHGMDHDCDGHPDDDDDGDGEVSTECLGTDCDDSNPDVRAGASEVECDGVDTDCDGAMHPTEDADGDGHPSADCAPAGVTPDCDEIRADVYPGAPEACDEVDQDCDGSWADGGADDDGDDVLDEACGGDDCDDGRADVFAGADEVCDDGVDQDCDGLADTPTAMLGPTRISDTPANSVDPEIVWTGSEWGVVWEDRRGGATASNIYLQRVAPDGAEIGSDAAITIMLDDAYDPHVGWSGSEMGVVWTDRIGGVAQVYFQRVSADGSLPAFALRVTVTAADARVPQIAWSGSEWGIAWQDERDGDADVLFRRVSASGDLVGSEASVTDTATDALKPRMDWSGSEWGVVWSETIGMQEDVWFARLDPEGGIAGAGAAVTSVGEISQYADIAWTGSEWGVAWADTRDANYEIYFTRLAAGGAPLGADVRVTTHDGTAHEPSLAWTGSVFGLSWQDQQWSYVQIAFVILDPAGTTLASAVNVSDRATFCGIPRLAWSGSEFGVVWIDALVTSQEVAFERVASCE